MEIWRREGDGWVHATYEAGARVELPSIDFVLSVDELYDEAGLR